MSKKQTFAHLDADETIFFSRELEHVKAKSYDVLYAELKARSLIPVSREANPGAETIRYEQYDQVGLAKLINSYSDELPRADLKGKEFVSIIKSLGASYGYALQEIRAARMAGKPLEQRRANAAKRAILQKENTLAFLGDSDANLGGLFTNANVPAYVLPADGTGSTTTFSTKTADQIIRDLHGIANSIPQATKGVEQPDTLLLPIEQYHLIASKKVGVDSNMTVLKFFMETTPYIKMVGWVNELDGAGAGGLDRMWCYKRDPDKVTLEIPQDFEQLDVEQRNLEFVVPCHSRMGGVLVYYPLSMAYADGI